MICTWLSEILLHQINAAEENMHSLKAVLDRNIEDKSDYYASEYKKTCANFTLSVNEFRNFLTNYKVFFIVNDY
jgi:hypothetical protein